MTTDLIRFNDVANVIFLLAFTVMLCVIAQRIAAMADSIVLDKKYARRNGKTYSEVMAMGEFICTLTFGALMTVFSLGAIVYLMRSLSDTPVYLMWPTLLLQVAIVVKAYMSMNRECRERYIEKINEQYGTGKWKESELAAVFAERPEFDIEGDRSLDSAILLRIPDGKDYCTNCHRAIEVKDEEHWCGSACMNCGAILLTRIDAKTERTDSARFHGNADATDESEDENT